MDKNIVIPINVSKESVALSEFPKEDVLKDSAKKEAIEKELEKAMTLGNTENLKIKIVFEDKEAVKQVETTVWAKTDKRIILKAGVVIPINRIHQVKII